MNGRPWVYILCDAADRPFYCERLACEVRRWAPCGVSVGSPEPEAEPDLLIAVVTGRFLGKESPAARELEAALERKIPVLPIMEEPGVEELFRERFGWMPFLERYGTCIYTGPFGQRLQEVLEEMLNRPVAEGALLEAASEGDPTAMGQLAAMYHYGIGVPRDTEQEILWRQRYGEYALKQYEQKTSPENARLAARAAKKAGDALLAAGKAEDAALWYKKGYRIINPFAGRINTGPELGEAAALCEGLGYACRIMDDREKSFDWFKRSFEIRLREADWQENPEGLWRVLVSGMLVGTLVSSEEDRILELRWCLRVLPYGEKLWDGWKEPVYAADLVRCYRRMGVLYGYRQEPDKARAYCEKAAELARTLWAEHGLRNICFLEAVEEMGDLCMEQGAVDEAKQWYEKAAGLIGPLEEEKPLCEIRAAVRISERLGAWIEETGDFEGARFRYHQGLDLSRQIGEILGTPDHHRQTASLYGRLGRLAWDLGDRSGAAELLTKGNTLLKKVVKATGAAKDRIALSHSYDRLGDLALEEELWSRALFWYERGMTCRKAMVTAEKNPETLWEVGTGCIKRGDYHYARREPEAKQWYEKGFEIYRALAVDLRDNGHLWDLSRGYDRLGKMAWREEDKKRQEWAFRHCYELRLNLQPKVPGREHREELAMSLFWYYMSCDFDPDLLNEAHEMMLGLTKQYPGVARYRENEKLTRPTIPPWD